MLTQDHLKWCQDHEWGRDAYLAGGMIGGLIDTISKDGETVTRPAYFDNWPDLREWAGY